MHKCKYDYAKESTEFNYLYRFTQSSQGKHICLVILKIGYIKAYLIYIFYLNAELKINCHFR